MGKKVKNLSDEEIEQHKNENYQMMAAIAGKSVSGLVSNEVHRGNYGEKDCLVKQLFLKNLVEPISSRRLFETLKKQGYDAKYTTFSGLLNRYERYGYVEKKTQKKPYIFGLTELGYEHAKNPYLAREKLARKRMNFIYGQIEKQLAEHPEALKNLVETISQMNISSPIGSGGGVSNSGSQYSSNDLGSIKDSKIEEYRNKIEDDGFLQSVNEDKIKKLIELGDSDLLTDFYINLNDYHQRHNKSSIIIKQAIYNSKPVGDRKYYPLLANSINKPVTKSLYEKIPFRFIYIPKKKELRLESGQIAGKYRNNEDGDVLDFYKVNNDYFGSRMMIKAKSNPEKRELEFFYVGGSAQYPITTMSFNDYNNVKNKKQATLKIINK